MLHSVLGILLSAAWIVFALVVIYTFWRVWRSVNFQTAARRLLSRQFVLPLLLMISLSFIKAGIEFIYPHQVGVVISLMSEDGIREEPLGSGLHWVVPLAEKVQLYPRYWQTYTMSSRPYEGTRVHGDPIVSRTKDNQEVSMDISIIFRVDPEQLVELHRFWQQRYREELLRPGVRAFLRRQVSQFTVDEVNSDKRNMLAQELDRELKDIALKNGLIIKRVLLRNISFTPQYAAAVERKQVALEGQIAKQYEAKQIENLAQGKARHIEIVADAEAEAIKVKAQAKAEARMIQARAEARALQLVSAALKDKQNLLTYRYIDRLSPNVQAVVLPHDMPLIFPLPDMQVPQTGEQPVAKVE